jgi:single-strand DNA-binding protein
MFMNRVTLIGFTGQDPKISAIAQSGREVTRFSVATTRRYQQQSEWKEKTQWHDCVFYGGNANSKLVKGAHVVIEGELTYREYTRTIETENGTVTVPWPVTEIIVASIRFLDRKRTDDPACEGAA